MTGYTIYYTDPAKSSTPIFVADNTKDTQSTSLTLIGRNYPGYGTAIAEDLLHLLENFAATTPPNNPIEGQLWLDTSDPNNKKLKINDGGFNGAIWSPVNGVFQQPNAPTNAKLGDIWVDTANTQLKFWNGVDFTLVGPNYSSATKTGSYSVQINDTMNNSHNVIINYVNDIPIEIIASESFTPNPVIDGFYYLYSGLNVSATYGQIYGTVDAASNLSTSLGKVSANSFLRNDVSQTLRGELQILVDANSLQIGADPTFILERRSLYNAVLSNQDLQGQFTLEVLNYPLMVADYPTKSVTINTTATANQPGAGLFVNGSVSATSSATVDTLYVMSTLSNVNSIAGNAVQIIGGAGINGTLVTNGEHILLGPLTIGVPAPSVPQTTSVVMPAQDGVYDIGSAGTKWRNVYGNVFRSTGTTAQFVGIATQATSLTSPSRVYLTGDLTSTATSFQGNGADLAINAVGNVSLINSRTPLTVVSATSAILVSSANQMYKSYKRDFLADVNYNDTTVVNPGYTTPAGSLVPIGTIIPWAGSVAALPAGWLLCDGSTVPVDDKYSNLKTVIGKQFDLTNTTYKLPDLRGKLSAGVGTINYIIKY